MWACRECTFENEPTDAMCSICDAPRYKKEVSKEKAPKKKKEETLDDLDFSQNDFDFEKAFQLIPDPSPSTSTSTSLKTPKKQKAKAIKKKKGARPNKSTHWQESEKKLCIECAEDVFKNPEKYKVKATLGFSKKFAIAIFEQMERSILLNGWTSEYPKRSGESVRSM